MRRDDLDKMNGEIDEVRAMGLDARKRAIRTRGWRRWVWMRFAYFSDWAARLGERIRAEELADEEPDDGRAPMLGFLICIMGTAVIFFALGAYFF